MRKILLAIVLMAFSFVVRAQNHDDALAKQLVSKNSAAIGMSQNDLANYLVSSSYFDKTSGSQLVYLVQSYQGLPVYNQMMVLAFKDEKLASNAGHFVPGMDRVTNYMSPNPSVLAANAVRTAISDIDGPMPAALNVINITENGRKMDFGKIEGYTENVTAELMWVPAEEGKTNSFKLAWQVQLFLSKKSDYWNVRVDANVNTVINKNNLTVYENLDQFKPAPNNSPEFLNFYESLKKAIVQKKTVSVDYFNDPSIFNSPSVINNADYLVIKYPAESPQHPGGTAAIDHNPWTTYAPGNATSLGWHNDGTLDYSVSRGNNVNAHEDRAANNSNAGIQASSSTPIPNLTFNFPPNYTVNPTTAAFQQFAITNLFYWNNLNHDLTYKYGFDEPGGNFQASNQGRGGLGGDYVEADAQDGSGTNNANMATPPDGSKPRMQMYLFNGVTTFTVNTPAVIAGNYTAVEGAMSTNNLLINVGPIVAQPLVWYNDDAAGNTHYACNAPANSVTGKVALITRGFGGAVCTATVPFTTKVKNAQNAGAIAVVMVNNVAGAPITMGGTDNTITIPAVMISDVDGATIAAQITNNVTVTMGAGPNLDGDIDNGVVSHEFFHGVSNRLTGGPATTSCLNNAEEGGEGWSDYNGLMITTDWSTALITDGFNKPRPIGTYAFGQPITGSGIRNYPYCTNIAVNPLTYANMGVAPIGTEVHNIGEIWCMACWEMTWQIIQSAGINPNLFNNAGTGGNSVAYQLVMQGLKLQPCSPGYIDARNAILKADSLLYNYSHYCDIWTAFAKRGMGWSASQGSSASATDQTPATNLPPAATITGQPVDATVCVGANATFTVTATGPNPRYQWQVSTTGVGGPYTNLTNTAPYSGVTTNTLTITNVTAPLNGNYYRCAVTGGCGNPATNSNGALLNANGGAPVINTQPSPASACAGSNATFSVTATGTPLAYQWQENQGAGFVNITNGGVYSGATTATLTLTGVTVGMNTWQYRCNVTGGCGSTTTTSNPATLTVTTGGTAVTGQPANATVCANANTSFSVTATGANLVYQWFLSTDGGATFNPISNGGVYSNATTATLNITGVLASMNNYRYRCFVTGSCPPPVTSNAGILTVNTAPAVTSQPTSLTVCPTSTVNFSVTATGTSVTYQWFLSTDNGATFNPIANGGVYSNATTATLTITGVLATMNNYQYRCVVSGTCTPAATSTAAILTVVTTTNGGTTSAPITVFCTSVNSGTITLSGYSGNIIQWESATNIAGPWTVIANTTNTQTFNNLLVTTYYRALVQATGCASSYSTITTIQVTALGAMTIVSDVGTTLCAGDPARLTVMDASGANPVSITESSSSTVVAGSVSCGTAATTSVNSFWRAYNLSSFPSIVGNFTITSVTFGIELTSGGPQNVTVRLYTQTGAAFPGGTQTQIATQTYSVPNAALGSFTATLTTPVTVPNTATIVVEVATAGAANTRFFIGSNALAETAPSYISAAACGIAAPVTFASLGFPNVHIILDLNGTVPTLGAITTGTFLWTPATGLSSTTSNPVAASPNTTTTYTVTHNNGGGCIRTAQITLNVNQRPVVTVQPVNVSLCATSSASFSITATGTALTYQWQESRDAGVTWANLANGAPYSGVTTPTLTINPTAFTMNGYRYRCVVSGTCTPGLGNPNISNAAILTVVALPTITVAPSGTFCGGVAGISGVALNASGANTYVWAPVTGLYTDALATIPYTGTNLATVYAAPTVFTTYTVNGTNTTTGCSNTASVNVNYTPPPPVVTPNPVTMCLGDLAVKLKSTSATPGSCTVNSGAISIPIPDATATQNFTAISTQNVSCIPANATITGISVTLSIPAHTYVADLSLNLKSPGGTVINLFRNLGATGGVNTTYPNTGIVNLTLSSASATPLSTANIPAVGTLTGTFKADILNAISTPFYTLGDPPGYSSTATSWAPMFANAGGAANGNWILAMTDDGAGDIGNLTNWSIKFDYIVGVQTTPATWSPLAGLFTDPGATIAYTGTPIDSVWTRPTPSGVYNYNVTVQSVNPPSATVATPMAGGNGNNMVFFNVNNSNAISYNITGISTNAFVTAVAPTVNVYRKTSPIAGNPGAINAGNGWILVGSASNVSVTANTLNAVLTGLAITIPAGQTYGIGLEFTGAATFPAYTNGTGTVATFTNNGCSVIVDGNVGWGGPVAPGPPANNPRNFNGTVIFAPANIPACTSPARAVTVTVNQPVSITSQPSNAVVCTDKVTTFSVTATGTGITYQWQVSTNAGVTYTNITNGGGYSGVTTNTLTITAPPVSWNGNLYRCNISGTAPCPTVSTAGRLLTVNPLPTVLLSASPYRNLLPGLRTTISSTSSPAAATYTWFRNGVVVPGATTGSLLVDVDAQGDYVLRVTDVNGCTNSSAKLTIADSTSGRVFISPNPTNGRFVVRYNPAHNNVLPRGIVVYDGMGKRVLVQNFALGWPFSPMPIDLSNHATGVYWIEVLDANNERLAVGRVDIVR